MNVEKAINKDDISLKPQIMKFWAKRPWVRNFLLKTIFAWKKAMSMHNFSLKP